MRTSKYRKKIKMNKKAMRILTGGLIALALAGVITFFVIFHVDSVEVMGSSYYTQEEIEKMVLRGPLAKNSVLAPMLYTKHNTEDIPFIEGIEVSQVNSNTICISVQEIRPVGCIKYLDCYMYFDRDGIIIASSVERDMRVPFFEGMEIQQVAFGDEVPFADESLLNTSVSLARIFAKNDEIPDHISYDSTENITLFYGGITAALGQDKYLEDKMTRLIAILPKVKGQAGILHLENVTDDKKVITFEKELSPEELAAQQEEEGSQEASVNSWESGSMEDSDTQEEWDSGTQEATQGEWDSGTQEATQEEWDSGTQEGTGGIQDSGEDSYDSSY